MAPRDRQLLDRYAMHSGNLQPSALYALKRALRQAGLAKGHLGFDDPRVLSWLNAIDMPVTGVDALNIFKEIRMVKTEAEIDLLRVAGHMSETALNAVIDAIEPGLRSRRSAESMPRRWRSSAAARNGSSPISADWRPAKSRPTN